MLAPREIPEDAKKIKISSDGQWIKLEWPVGEEVKNEIRRLDDKNKIITLDYQIHIYFPSFDHFYVQTYNSENGFTLAKIIELICETGYNAMKNWFIISPDSFDAENAEEAGISVGEYSLSMFHMQKNNIYVNVDH